jgi:hypothetical protein
MDRNGNLKNGIGIQMNEFDLEMVKEAAEEITAREAESMMEESFGHNDFISVQSGDFFTFC